MKPLLTKIEARRYLARWRRVNARQEEEMRSTSIDVKWQQFNTLLRWAYEFGWNESLAQGEAEVRQRWARFRKALRGKKGKS